MKGLGTIGWRRTMPRIAIVLGTVGVAGCAVPRPIAAWQDSLTTYISREGHGDPNILRDSPQLRSTASLRPATIRFNKLDLHGFGLPPFNERWDAHGVMLDTSRSAPGRYAFLVGVVKRPPAGPHTLEDLRLIVFDVDRDDLHWRVSEPDPSAVRKYLQAVAESDANQALGHPRHQTFPAIDDVFRFEMEGATAVAKDERSGATWRVKLRDRAALSTR